MSIQGWFNAIFMLVMILLIIADAVFVLVSWWDENWSVLIGALCGAIMVVLIYGLCVLGNLKV